MTVLMVMGFCLGASLGSFAACMAYRIPRGMNLLASSCCDSCGEKIPPWLNVPVIGWVALRGRSACCGKPLSPGLLIWELAIGIAGAAGGWAVAHALGV